MFGVSFFLDTVVELMREFLPFLDAVVELIRKFLRFLSSPSEMAVMEGKE